MILSNTVYDRKWLIWCTVGLAAMSVAMKLTGGLAFALIFPMILAAFGKNRTELMLYCLLMTIAVTMANGNIVTKSAAFGLMARGVHFLIAGVMTLQIVGQRNSRLTTPLLALLPYLVYMAIVSASGWQPLISYLKLVLFLVMFFGFYSVANAAAIRQGVDARKLRSVLLSFAVYFLFGSVLLIPFPGISTMSAEYFLRTQGYVPEGSLFMGMTLHPQALGPVTAAITSILLADLLFCVRSWDKVYLLLLFCAPILIYKTGSRTAMGTFLATVCFVTVLLMQSRGRLIGAHWKQRALTALITLGLLASAVLFSTPGMRAAVARFALKYVDQNEALDVSWDAVTATRQGSVEEQMVNFRESPWIGNGFQVSRQLADKEIVSWEQLLSAPVEKGVWVTAVLEEGGIFGMILFLIFLLVAVVALWQRRAYVGLSVLVLMIVANLGEFTMFSMTSTGGLVWSLVFVGLALDAHRQRAVRGMRYPLNDFIPVRQ